VKPKEAEPSNLVGGDFAPDSGRDVAEVLSLIYAAVAELNLQRSENQQLKPTLDMALFGDAGNLDSLALANFIIIMEQKFEGRFGVRVDLTQEDPFSLATGHFQTVRSLATYISSLVPE
jgi:acyl carrier protein